MHRKRPRDPALTGRIRACRWEICQRFGFDFSGAAVAAAFQGGALGGKLRPRQETISHIRLAWVDLHIFNV